MTERETIDIPGLVRRKDVLWITKETGALETQRCVRELPAVDAVEVVRCKDCAEAYHSGMLPDDCVWCEDWGTATRKEGYCFKGKRREEHG